MVDVVGRGGVPDTAGYADEGRVMLWVCVECGAVNNQEACPCEQCVAPKEDGAVSLSDLVAAYKKLFPHFEGESRNQRGFPWRHQ